MDSKEKSLKVGEETYPVSIYVEHRRNSRVSIGRAGIMIRIPIHLSTIEKDRQVEEFVQWARKRIEKDPHRFLPEKEKEYSHCQEISLLGRKFMIRFIETNASRASSRVSGNSINIFLPKDRDSRNRMVSDAIERAAKKMLPHLKKRVSELNEIHFRKEFSVVRIRNSKSTWGSCSRRGEITLSSRLMLAPAEIIDYVIIHELAHLSERNHSSRFWKIVEKACPDCKEKRKWLRKNGHEIRF